jgi:hypothetical protein
MTIEAQAIDDRTGDVLVDEQVHGATGMPIASAA